MGKKTPMNVAQSFTHSRNWKQVFSTVGLGYAHAEIPLEETIGVVNKSRKNTPTSLFDQAGERQH